MKIKSSSKDSIHKRALNEIKELNQNFHQLSFEELAQHFNTSLQDGLDKVKAQQLLLKNGKNKVTLEKKNVFLKLFGFLFSGFCGLLWMAAIICILAWKPIGEPNSDPLNLGLGILLVVVILLQAVFTAFQEWSSSRVMKSIKNMMPHSATVIRNGIEYKIPVEELVVGDLVVLSYGNKVPADCRIVEAIDLKFDKSMLTGESDAIEGTVESTDERYVESKNIAYMTTLITNGQGKGIVVNTGDKTMMGKIACLTNNKEDKDSSLQKELKRFVHIIACAALVVAITICIVWFYYLRIKYPNYLSVSDLMVNTISVMVGIAPVGLPVCVTMALLIIAKRMAKSRVLVKNLYVIETLSCVNVIASDKTGTLTQNKMFVANALVGEEPLDIDLLQFDNDGTKQFIGSVCLCNNAHFEENDKNPILELRQAIGDATDVGLLRFSAKHKSYTSKSSMYREMWKIPFNSRNKWMVTVVKSEVQDKNESMFQEEPSTHLMLIKGAPDILLKKCEKIIRNDGTETELTDEIRANLIKTQDEWCLSGQRVIVICKRICKEKEIDNMLLSPGYDLELFVNLDCNDFTLIGMIGMVDPPREGISDVISSCKEASIRVLMITGDYLLTAAAIARKVGIFTNPKYDTVSSIYEKAKEESAKSKNKQNKSKRDKNAPKTSLVLNGSDLINLTSTEWRIITKYDEIVFARTTPEQKLMIVKEFQKDQNIVGVTGDGVNDAPALKSADIGIAMGSGSEVAIESGQLVLLDNNFSSILIAIENGRLVFNNLKKVIIYLIPAGSFAELIPMLMAIFLGVPQNLSSFQMLVICLFTDVSPSLSLIMEKPEINLLKQPPRSKYDHIIDCKFLLHAYFFLGVQIASFSQLSYFLYMYVHHNILPQDLIFSFGNLNGSLSHYDAKTIKEIFSTGQTVTFASLVIMQIFGNLLSTRTRSKSFFSSNPLFKPYKNKWIIVAQLISFVILILTVNLEWVNNFFETRHIPFEFYILPVAYSIIIFCNDELRKLMVRRKILFFDKIGW